MQREGSARPSTGRPLSGLPAAAVYKARPITQQGLSGPRRLGTAQGSNRVYKDKRFYISQITGQMHIMQEEIAQLKKAIVEGKVVSVTKPELKRIAEKSARKFIEQQELLNTYNNALDFHMSYIPPEKVLEDTLKIKEKNRQLMDDLENLQMYKIKREEKLKEVKKELKEEEQFMKSVIETLSDEERSKYMNLFQENKKCVEKVSNIQRSIKNIREEIEKHEKALSVSKYKQSKLALLKAYDRHKRQKVTLNEQLNEISSPEKQKEVLLQQVKKDKMDIEVVSKTKSLLEEEKKEKQERLQMMEDELDETNNKRLEKHKELRQRETVMNEFIETFSDKKSKLQKSLQEEQDKVVRALEVMGNTLADIELSDANINPDIKKMSVEELRKQYNSMRTRVERINNIKERDENEMKQLIQENVRLKNELNDFKDIERKKTALERGLKNAKEENENGKNKLSATKSAVAEAERKKLSLEEKLNKNKEYSLLMEADQKLDNMEKEMVELENEIKNAESETILNNKLKEVQDVVGNYNNSLKKRLKRPKYVTE